jgi:DNA-binding MarR family transcriptional regulator
VSYTDQTAVSPVPEVLDAFGELSAAQRRLRGRDAQQPGGLSFAQLRLLNALEEDDGCPAGRLAERAGVTPATVTGMLDVLEEQGVVTRERSARDRRVVIARLSEEGRRLRDRRRAEVRRVFEDALAGLDPADLAAAPRVLRRLAEVMDGL